MPIYRLRHRYRTEPDREFEAANDVEAIKLARRRYAKHADYALRCGDRCVALLPHDDAALLVSSLGDFASGNRTALSS